MSAPIRQLTGPARVAALATLGATAAVMVGGVGAALGYGFTTLACEASGALRARRQRSGR